jgi:1-acyl-sn-glycerol-3-phosphate acyltransferase
MAAIAEPGLTEEDQLEALTRLNAEDLVTAFKLDRLRPARGLIDGLARLPARRFSRQVARCDQIVATQGLAAAGRYILELFARSVTISGQEYIPAHGPLLVVSNHPGMADAMALWIGLEQRPDLRIIAAERALLRVLPHMRRYLLFVAEQSGSRTSLLRQAAGHMRAGGALLTFPAGHIEPDPAVRPGAIESLACWSGSVALFARLVPDAVIVPVAVGGVISATALRNPLISLFRSQKDRDWAAATLQVLIPAYRDTHTRVAFGPALPASSLAALDDPSAISAAVAEQMRPLLTRVGSGGAR